VIAGLLSFSPPSALDYFILHKEGCVLRFLTPLDARIGRFLHFIGKKTVTAFGIGGTDPMIMCNLK
jgi:hypothetical protein